jgi:ADP-heptose:LPS heptosyltransferase
VSLRLHALGAREVVVAAPPPQAGSRRHVARQLLGALTPLGVPVPAGLAALPELLPPLRWPQDSRAEAQNAWGRVNDEVGERLPVVLHPGAGGASKRWPASQFAALIRALRADLAPVLIAGPQDEAIVARIVAEVGATATVRDLSVAGLAAFLSTCGQYIGNDSGVTHLAGMLGVPTIALFGPTDPALWSPLGPRVVALRSPTGRMEDMPPEAVVAAIADG